MAKKVPITKVLSCFVVIVFLMSSLSVAVIASDSSNSTASNVTDNANTSSPDPINESVEVPDPNLPVLNDTDISTAKTVSSLGYCSYVWIEITDKYCKGYEVYVDGVYQFTEGEDSVPDGYCSFKVTPGYHTFKLTLNGKEVSKGWNCQCGTGYNWMSMNNMIPHWCEGGNDNNNQHEVKFRGEVTYDSNTLGAGTYIVTVDEVLYDPQDYFKWSGDAEVNWDIWKDGPYVENADVGDKVEVFGRYTKYDDGIHVVDLETSSHYLKKISSESLSINVWTDKSEYKIGETVTIYYKTNKKCTAKLTITKPDGGDVVYGPNEIPASTRSKSATAGYPTGKRTVVFEVWAGAEYKKATCYFDVVDEEEWEVKFQATVNSTYPEETYFICEVRVDKIISDPDDCIEEGWIVDIVLEDSPCGSYEEVKKGDKIEVFGKRLLVYSFPPKISLCGKSSYYLKKIDSKTLSISVWTDKSEYKIGETVTIYYKTNKKCTAKLTITKPDGGDVVYGPNEIPASTRSKSSTAGYPTGKRTVVFAAWDGAEYKKATCYFDVVEEKKPDLIIQDISLSPPSPKNGDTVTFTVKIKNKGSENAEEFYVCYYVDGSYYARDYINSLSAGSTTTTSFTWTAECGSHSIKAYADCYDAIDESNGDNNEKSIIIEVGKKSVHNIDTGKDFATIQAAIDDSNTGHTITVDAGTYVENVEVTKSLTIKSTSGNPKDTIVQAAASNQNYQNVFTVTADNVHIDGFTIKGASYLWCSGILIGGGHCVISNNTFEDNAIGIWTHPPSGTDNTIRNNNFASSSEKSPSTALYIESSGNKIYLNNFFIGTMGGGSYFSTLWNSPSKITYTYNGNTFTDYLGNYWDDYKDKYPGAKEKDGTGIWDTPYEIDEDKDYYPLVDRSENYIEKIDKKPDLIIEDILYTPEEPTLQETIGFYVNVKNQGQSACKSFNVKFILGDLGDFFGLTERVDGLNPGASEKVAFFYYPGEEKSEISKLIATISVDSSQEISESREDNNEKSITIEIKSAAFIEIEISKYYIKEDCDPSWPGVADPYFLIDVEGINGAFRSPEEDYEPKVDQVGKGYPGPIYIPDYPVSLPAEITIKAIDSDPGGDDELGNYRFILSSLPQANSFDNGENIYFDIMAREVPATPLDRITGGTNDPENSKQWYWYQVGANQVWQDEHYRNKLTSEESEIIVAVLDTGVDYNHPDLNSVDDDNNGFVDDWNGYDFIDNDHDPMDEGHKRKDGSMNYHGTKVAGIIAAEINNGEGIAGVAPNVKIMPLRVIPTSRWEEFENVDDIAKAIKYATDKGAKVISMSLGAYYIIIPGQETKLREAIDYAYEKGVILIAAAGNERTSKPHYPAVFNKVVSVSALKRIPSTYGGYLTFADAFGDGGSNYGPSHSNPDESIQFSAPGKIIWTTYNTEEYELGAGYGQDSGTSVAAPIVSAIAAMVLGYAKSEYDTELTPDQVRSILKESASDLGAPGWDSYYGYGMVNAYQALQEVDEVMPPICVKGGCEDYRPLKVFFRGSSIHVNLANADVGEHTFDLQLWEDSPGALNLKVEDGDLWHNIDYKVKAGAEVDLELPANCPIGLYRLQVDIGGSKYTSNNFYIIFDPEKSGIGPDEKSKYFDSEDTGDRNDFSKKLNLVHTNYHSEPVMTAMAAAATSGLEIYTSREDTQKAIGNWVCEVMDSEVPSDPPNNVSDYIDIIRSGEKLKGDCDCYTVLLIALARASGTPAREIIGVGVENDSNDNWVHTWTEIYINDWKVFDPFHSDWEWGTNYPGYIESQKNYGYLGELEAVWEELGSELTNKYKPSKKLVATLKCLANLHAYDSLDNHVGVNTKGEIELEIQNSYYTGPDSEPEEIVIFGQSENVKFKVEALDEGKFNLTITQSMEAETKKISYNDVPIAETTEATVDVSEANPTYIMEIDDDGDGTTDRKREPEPIDVIGQDSYSIQLRIGWNLISLPLTPEDTDILNVMSPVADNWNSVWSYEGGKWKRYDLTGPDFLNTLTIMEPGKGYWLHMKSDDTLSISGSEPTVKSIPLSAGWNLVGYNSLNSMPTTEAMSSVAGNWNSVWSYEAGRWKRYDLTGPDFLNSLTIMEPGKGYWLNMKSPDTWTLGA